MTLIQPLLMELDQEAATTRRVLERMPSDKLGWKPHARARSLGELGVHIATAQKNVSAALQSPTFEMVPHEDSVPAKTEEIVALFDESTKEAREMLSKMTDADLMSEWSLLVGGTPRFTAPKIGVIRGIVLNHVYHHRGQLSVYLRELGVQVPSIYGPSADENPFA
ncbi:MAG: DinB family protein [Thermoanaerobaculia bacterium]